MNTNPEWLLLYAGLLAIVAEAVFGVRTGYDLVVAGAAMVTGGAIGVALDNWPTGLSVALVIMVFYVLLWRRNVRKTMKGEADADIPETPTILPTPPDVDAFPQKTVAEASVEPESKPLKRIVRKSSAVKKSTSHVVKKSEAGRRQPTSGKGKNK